MRESVCLESVLLSAESKWILNPHLLFFFVAFVLVFFAKRGNKKLTFYASLFNTHKYIFIRKNKNGSDDSTKNPRRVQRLLRYVLSLSSSFGLKPGLVVVARGRAIFYESKFSPKANFVIIV